MRVICTVESMNYSACGLEVGDSFELDPDAVSVPAGKGFCFFAVSQVVTAVHARLSAGTPDDYLRSLPLIACPDPPEAVRIRVRVQPPAAPGHDHRQRTAAAEAEGDRHG